MKSKSWTHCDHCGAAISAKAFTPFCSPACSMEFWADKYKLKSWLKGRYEECIAEANRASTEPEKEWFTEEAFLASDLEEAVFDAIISSRNRFGRPALTLTPEERDMERFEYYRQLEKDGEK